jgi:hypothetical protein
LLKACTYERTGPHLPLLSSSRHCSGLAVRRQLNVTLAQLIHEAQPYQKLIVIMREPVSRYYSAFHYYG